MKEINFWDANFVVVDVETTGNLPTENRIIDIAAVNVKNGDLDKEYSSLINPHQFIPPFISQMTNISNEAVFYAPEAIEVMPKFLKSFDNANSVFVAHNANFDLSFVQATLKRIGIFDFNYPVLDTLKLARRVLNDTQKKSVGNLAQFFGIKVRNRHSALGDAKATAKILIYLLEIIEEEHEVTSLEELLNFQNKKLSFLMPKPENFIHLQDKLQTLPDEPGVYYFLDKRKKIIYIGKAKNLKNRVSSYFQPGNISSPKLKELTNHIADLKWVETNNELDALLLEAKEIKANQPKFNFAGRRTRRFPFLKISTSELFPKVEIVFDIDDDSEYYGPFTNKAYAEEIQSIIDKNFQLVKCDHKFDKSSIINEPCLYLQLDLCLAPCIKRYESDFAAKYELEIDKIKKFLSGFATQLVKSLENKMLQYSQSLDFEKANEMKKAIFSVKSIFNNTDNFFNSINQQNFVLILPNFSEEKLMDIFLFRFNKLKYHQTIGKKDVTNNLLIDNINKIYFNGLEVPKNLSSEEIEEIKITNSWLNQNKENGKVIYFEKHKNLQDLISAIKNASKEL